MGTKPRTTTGPTDASHSAVADQLSLAEAVPVFLEYLKSYRSCAAVSVRAYGRDLRGFQEFLAKNLDEVPSPGQITRQQVMQFAMSLSHLAPISVRRKLAALASFFGFLQDMGYVSGNPARRLPLPKLEQHVPVTLSEHAEVRR